MTRIIQTLIFMLSFMFFACKPTATETTTSSQATDVTAAADGVVAAGSGAISANGPLTATITMTATATNGLNSQNYILVGTAAGIGRPIVWTKSAASTCIAPGIC